MWRCTPKMFQQIKILFNLASSDEFSPALVIFIPYPCCFWWRWNPLFPKILSCLTSRGSDVLFFIYISFTLHSLLCCLCCKMTPCLKMCVVLFCYELINANWIRNGKGVQVWSLSSAFMLYCTHLSCMLQRRQMSRGNNGYDVYVIYMLLRTDDSK